MNTDEALTIARQVVEGWAWKTETSQPEPYRLDVRLASKEDLIPIIVAFRVKRMGYLAAITGLDLGPEDGHLEVLYHFCTAAAVITLRLSIPREQASVPSLCSVIPSAEAFERELSEMFGVEVEGLPNPMRLYLPDDWSEGVYPLRKDVDEMALTSQVVMGEI
ncbi:MAG TPA: NADH-quinone oxidoreductase subunit C [Anaerolineae bacterium]|nr:NADH-quinone oxidoreductase subunit C [Anaerolineae bacterium]